MKSRHSGYNCQVGATLSLIGGKYKALILWHLVNGPLRFGELKRLIPQATPKMLTQQLRELERDLYRIRPSTLCPLKLDISCGVFLRPASLKFFEINQLFLRKFLSQGEKTARHWSIRQLPDTP